MNSPNPTGDLFADLAAAGPALAGAPALPPVPPRLVSTDPSTLATPAAARELWLCLWLPRLPLEALATDPARPAAAVAGAGTRRRLLACNAAAARAGVTPGQGLNAALALVPELALHERSPALEAALLGRLARWGTQFTPLASLEPPDALLLEVRGSRRLFGGAEPLRRRAAAGLAAQGYTVVAALAPTPRAALWLARAGLELTLEAPAALPALASRLPLSCLCWPAAAIEALTRFGVATVADLVRLPRDGLARRLGPELLAELDEAFGRRPSPRRRAVAPLRFAQALELPAEIESTVQLMPAVSLLVRQLVEFLRSRGAGVPGLVLEFRHRSLPPTRLRLGLARPSADERHLCTLLGERLARLALPAPVRALRLRTGPVMPLEGATASLLAAQEGKQAARDPAAAARLVERLRARLGSAAVFGVQPVPEHRPESAWRVAEPAIAPPRQPAARRGGHSATTMSGPAATGADRPLWMLASPLPLAERDGRPCYEGGLELIGDPERIESGWWDGRDVRRDYYVAEARCGVRLWIYRERSATGGWFLHGVFG